MCGVAEVLKGSFSDQVSRHLDVALAGNVIRANQCRFGGPN